MHVLLAGVVAVVAVAFARFQTERGRPPAVARTTGELRQLARQPATDGFSEAILVTEFGLTRWHRIGTLQADEGDLWWQGRWQRDRVNVRPGSLVRVRAMTRAERMRWGPARHVLELADQRGRLRLLIREEDLIFAIPHLYSRRTVG